jgi:exopolysaccharide biosynthesis polyprenyl glycosylphosphotransferase
MFSHQRFVLVLGDIVALIASFCVMAVVRFDVGAQGSRIWYQMELFAVLFAVWVIVFFIFELYNLRRINPNPRNIGLLIAAMVINFFLGVLLFYLVPSGGITPKTNLIILIACAFIVLVIWRRIFYLLFTKRFVRRIGIIGTNPLIEHLTRELAAHPHLGTIIGHWNTPEDMTRARAHLVIADNIDPQTLLRLSYDLNTETVSLTEAYETLFAKIPVELMTNQKAIELMTNRTTPAQRAIYRVFEIIIAVLVLIISSPFLLIAIIARYIEDGSPVFYSQTRVGKGGSIFHIYKIRSMKKQAEQYGALWAEKNDQRITKLGRILRTTHIDEIPQMWNVIRGDLALIGPRAERPEFVATLEKEIPYYYLRHTIRPGFTGWAQIKFRYARTVDDSREKFEYDLYYLKNKHPLLDMGIILKTLQIIFTH